MGDTAIIVPQESHLKDRARAKARNVLGGSAVFQSMSLDDQKSIYLSLVQELIDKEKKLPTTTPPQPSEPHRHVQVSLSS